MSQGGYLNNIVNMLFMYVLLSFTLNMFRLHILLSEFVQEFNCKDFVLQVFWVKKVLSGKTQLKPQI